MQAIAAVGEWMATNRHTHTFRGLVWTSKAIWSTTLTGARWLVIFFPAHNISTYIFIVYNYLSYSSETLMQQASAHKTEATPAKAVIATTNDRQGDIECLQLLVVSVKLYDQRCCWEFSEFADRPHNNWYSIFYLIHWKVWSFPHYILTDGC